MTEALRTEVSHSTAMSTTSPSLNDKKKSRRKGQANSIRYCLCGYGDGEMIGCDGDNCEGNNWYHLECLQTVLGISKQRSKRLRGEWFCPSCKEKAAKKLEKQRQRTSTSTSVGAIATFLRDETKYVLSPGDKGKKSGSLPPLRVESAERQSREEMESLMSTARLLAFGSNGCVVASSVDEKKEGADFPHGLSLLPLSPQVFASLQSLHEVVVHALEAELRLTPWAGIGESDARKRGYAFLPSRFGKFGKSTLSSAGVRFHAAEKKGNDAKKDENANWHSCFRLSNAQITPEHENGLRAVVEAVAAAVPQKYKACITLDQLQAIQPNLHNGRDHLPVHIDSPLNDGFGVVIVTICIQKSADILLLSNESSKAWLFNAPQGSMYVLSSTARNACDHGVVCPLEKRKRREADTGSSTFSRWQETCSSASQDITGKKRKKGRMKERPGRESLNLRFALHGNVPSKPYFVGEEMPHFSV